MKSFLVKYPDPYDISPIVPAMPLTTLKFDEEWWDLELILQEKLGLIWVDYFDEIAT